MSHFEQYRFNHIHYDYRLSSVLGHDLSTHSRIYEEHMATGVARFVHVPALLTFCEEGKISIFENMNLPPLT